MCVIPDIMISCSEYGHRIRGRGLILGSTIPVAAASRLPAAAGRQRGFLQRKAARPGAAPGEAAGGSDCLVVAVKELFLSHHRMITGCIVNDRVSFIMVAYFTSP